MRLVSFREDGRVAVGVLTEDGETVVDLGRVEQRLDTDMISLLGGGQDARSVHPIGSRLGLRQQPVHHVIVMGGIVVEQRQRLGPSLPGDQEGVVDGAMAPVGFGSELCRRVLSVMDQQVGAVAQLEHRIGHRVER